MPAEAFEVTFVEPLTLSWPASDTWYDFLKKTHEALARARRHHYADKDVMLVDNLLFLPEGNGYRRFIGMDAAIVRFNERGNSESEFATMNDGAVRFVLSFRSEYGRILGFSAVPLEQR